MSGGAIAALGGALSFITFSGSFSKSAAPSGGRVISDAITVYVPIGNAGQLEMFSRSDTGTITDIEFRINGGAWSTFGTTGVIANGDTMEISITGAAAGESSQFSIRELFTSQTVGGPYTIAAT